MKNITLSAKDETIDGLRRIAKGRQTSVNDFFRDWAEKFVAKADKVEAERRVAAFEKSVKDFSFTSDGRKYSREEMNER